MGRSEDGQHWTFSPAPVHHIHLIVEILLVTWNEEDPIAVVVIISIVHCIWRAGTGLAMEDFKSFFSPSCIAWKPEWV